MVKKWIARVVALAIVVFAMVETKVLFDKIKNGDFTIEALYDVKRESYAKSVDTSKDSSSTTVESVEKEEDISDLGALPQSERSSKTGDDFYLNLSHYVLWESGEYDENTGEKAEQRRRLRYPDLIEIDCPSYNVALTEGYKLRICEYTEDKVFVRSVLLKDGEVYEVSRIGEYFSVTIIKDENEKSLSPGQWNGIFSGGINIIICTDKWLNYSGKAGETSTVKVLKTNFKGNLSDVLLADKDDEFAEILWNYQVENGIYSVSDDAMNNNNPTYYISSSDGDDDNSGLSPDSPKKSVQYFSGMSDINILLKCGDIFDVPKGIKVGNNCMIAAYGQGSRPRLNFYRKLDVEFTKSDGIENVWEADLSSLDIVKESGDKDNCNIGQLIIDGEINWKRFVWSSKEEYNPHHIENSKDGAWAVDWKTSRLYLYSETDPNECQIEYAPPVTAITVQNVQNVTIKGIEVRGAGCHGCNILSSKNVDISCCYFNNIGGSIHLSSGMRYGNAFQVWNGGSNINVHNNLASWIFDTCFTHQGSDRESVVEHVHFTDNIGSHFYWGIEVWGDGYSNNGFEDVTYTGNVLYDNIDLTNPDTPMQVGKNSRLLGVSDKDYVSYRVGYKYHQMSSINVNNSGSGQVTKVENNIAWNSNRFLLWATNSRNEENFSALMNNLFYAEGALNKACLMRYTINGEKIYCDNNKYIDSSNTWSVHFEGEEYDCHEELEKLEGRLDAIAGR